MPLRGAFTALLLLMSAPTTGFGLMSPAAVPSPTNVHVTCHNLRTTVSWDYDRQQPPTRFTVEVNGSDGTQENETTELEFDLSPFVWASKERYLGLHYVTVRAVQGGRLRSLPVKSKTFSFSDERQAYTVCALDFPPVNVAAEDSATSVTFQNPFHFYKELKQADKRDDAFFEFNVTVDQVDYKSLCSLTQAICRYDVPFSDGAERCVTLKGWLNPGNRIEYVGFRKSDLICPSAPTGGHVVTLAVLLSVLFLTVSVLTVSICAVKAWRLKPTHPDALDFPGPLLGEHHMKFNNVPREEISPVTVTRVGPEDGMVRGDGPGTDKDSADDSERTLCVVGVEAEQEQGEAMGHYDRPHALREEDMGNGDMVDCYCER
ncbi:interferon gamma receptor 1 isoform X1 [Scophthalmus maximus]|uniref:interferon gamma receptor 1 isoform X1 n=1 Tax=Scophthalmus maximus TaxID=52904 RepID=UPI001FA93E4C|nr:interferon gamma receptor 1 isoform X1 [Scophthalmus maximus]